MSIEEKTFKDAMTVLEGMGSGFALVVVNEYGVFTNVKADSKNQSEMLSLMDGLKICMDKVKLKPLDSLQEMMKTFFDLKEDQEEGVAE